MVVADRKSSMYDPYDQVRRMMEGYRSISDQMNSAVRAASLVEDQFARQLANYAKLSRFTTNLDSYLPARNLLDRFRIEQSLIIDNLQRAYLPEFVARVDEMLAGIQGKATSLAHFEPGLAESFAESSRLSAANFAAFKGSWSQLTALQETMAAPWINFTSRLAELKPLLSAQSNWARTVQLPSSITEIHHLANETRALFEQISALYSSWGPLPDDFEEVKREEQTEQAIALANERLAAAFTEKSPRTTLLRIGELLSHLKSGALRLAPTARKVFLHLLIHFICTFIVDYSLEFYKEAKTREAPRVCKEVRREVRKLQRELGPLSRDLRVVIASELIVRRGPAQSTPAVGRLFVGDLVVRIQDRTLSWSHVEFQDEEGDVVLRGWVFSRYIKPLSGCVYRPCRRESGLRRSPDM